MDHASRNPSIVQHARAATVQHAEGSCAQHAAETPPHRVCDVDGACRELNKRGLGLALLVDADGRATVVECAEPIGYRLSVLGNADEALLDPRSWVS